jgi:hypothetical protein
MAVPTLPATIATVPYSLDFGWLAERADESRTRVACFKAVEQRGGLAHGLDHNRDGSGSRIGALDGERDALAIFLNAQNDELTWPLLARNARCRQHELPDVETGRAGFHNPEHSSTPFGRRAGLCAAKPAHALRVKKRLGTLNRSFSH